MKEYLDSTGEKHTVEEAIAERKDIFVVYCLTTSGLISIRAICTKRWIANIYRKMVKHEDATIRVWVEVTITNHLYGNGAFESMLYGTQVRKSW